MKSLFIVFILFTFSAFAQTTRSLDLALLHSIDDLDFPQNYVEASEEALPQTLYQKLMAQINLFQFTLMEETVVTDLFEKLKRDPKARMKKPAGLCAYRRAHIQRLLKIKKVVSGQLLVKCPRNDGRLRLRDQVSGRYFSYTNFHDANIVTINTNQGIKFRIIDVQFEAGPVTLEDYLGKIEASQKIRPMKTKGSESVKKTCYWSIKTPYNTFKKLQPAFH